MIISHKHKFVFIHNPKVAGSAVRKALEHLHDDPQTFWHQGYLPELERVVDLAHLTFNDLLKIRPQCKDYTVLAVWRDPYERFVSGMKEHARQHGVKIHTGKDRDALITKMSDAVLRFDWKYVHLCPQHYFFRGVSTRNLIPVYHKHLGETWHRVQTWFKERGDTVPDLSKERVRPDPSGSWSVDKLDEFTIQFINWMYHADFLFFSAEKRATDYDWLDLEHSDRVNSIHSPFLPLPALGTLTAGEKIAYEQRVGQLRADVERDMNSLKGI